MKYLFSLVILFTMVLPVFAEDAPKPAPMPAQTTIVIVGRG